MSERPKAMDNDFHVVGMLDVLVGGVERTVWTVIGNNGAKTFYEYGTAAEAADACRRHNQARSSSCGAAKCDPEVEGQQT